MPLPWWLPYSTDHNFHYIRPAFYLFRAGLLLRRWHSAWRALAPPGRRTGAWSKASSFHSRRPRPWVSDVQSQSRQPSARHCPNYPWKASSEMRKRNVLIFTFLVLSLRADDWFYLWLNISVNHSLEVHEVDGGKEFGHEFGSGVLVELSLTLNTVQELPSLQVFHHNVGMGFVLQREREIKNWHPLDGDCPSSSSSYLYHINELHDIWVSLAQSQEFDLFRAVHLPGDDLDGELGPGLPVDAPPTHGEGAVA